MNISEIFEMRDEDFRDIPISQILQSDWLQQFRKKPGPSDQNSFQKLNHFVDHFVNHFHGYLCAYK